MNNPLKSIPEAPTPEKRVDLVRGGFARLKAFLMGRGKLFFYVVLLPTFLAILYFWPIASDVYVSESKFVVRSPQAQMQSGGLGGILSTIGVNNAG